MKLGRYEVALFDFICFALMAFMAKSEYSLIKKD